MAERGSKELKILILEDAPGDAKLMEVELQEEGLAFTATRVDSRETFRQALATSPPDLILADYSLPAFSGLDALQEVRGQCPDVPMIFVSGYINEEEAIEVVRMGATDYVLKHRLARLAPAVRRAIREAEDRRRRRQAEMALKRSMRRNRLILEAAGEGIITLNRVGKITFANPAAATMLGLTPGELVGQPLKNIAPRLKLGGRSKSESFSLHGALLPGGAPGREEEFRRGDGQKFPAEFTIEPLLDDGSPLGAVLTFSDISARRQAEEALRKSEATLRAVFQESGIGIALVDREGHPVITNPALQEMLGYTGKELQQVAFADLVHPEDCPDCLGLFRDLREGRRNRGQMEMRYVRRDGAFIWGRLTVSNIADAEGNCQFAAGMIEDLTECQRAQAALQESEERFALFMRHFPGIAVMRDPQGRYVFVNKGWEDAFQTSRDDCLDKSLEEVWPPPEARQFREDDQAVIAGRQPSREIRQLPHRDGRHDWLMTRFPIFGQEDQPMLIGAFGLDITEQRRSEEQAQRHLRSLNQLIAGVGKLAKIRDPDAMIQEICQLVVEAFEARLVWLGRAEPDGRVHPLRWAGETADYLNDIEVRWDETPKGQGPTGQAIRSGQPVVFRDLAAEAAFAPWREAALARGYRTSAAIPLKSDHHTFGALMVYSEQADFFPPARVELLQAYAGIAAAALENARLDQEAERRLRQLDALRIVDLAVIASLDLRVTLNVFLDQLTGQLRVDAALVLLLNPQTRSLEYGADRGFKVEGLKKVKLAMNQGFAGRVVQEQRLLHIPNLAEAEKDFALAPIMAREEFRAAYVVPLLSKGQVNGVLEIFNRTAFPEDAEWLEFLVDLAGQAAIGIDNDSLFNGLQRSHAEMVRAYEATLEGWAKALELRDGDTKGHSERVVDLTLSTARALGVAEEELVHFRRGALLHDIGKICVPDHILLKPGPLSREEWAIMRRHPVYAREWLSPISYLEPALDIPYCHHEKWDGSGYPQGLKGEAIPLAARIFAVVDVWEALTSDRPYRAAWPREQVLIHLQEQAGKHFDSRVVEAFLEKVIMAEPPAGAK
jgi:PAS domain S-box-containing protein